MKRLKAGGIKVGFVQAHGLEEGREVCENGHEFLGSRPVLLEVPGDEDRLRAKAAGGYKRHPGVESEPSGFVGGSGDHSPLVGLAADHHRLTLQFRVDYLLHRDEEGIQIYVHD